MVLANGKPITLPAGHRETVLIYAQQEKNDFLLKSDHFEIGQSVMENLAQLVGRTERGLIRPDIFGQGVIVQKI